MSLASGTRIGNYEVLEPLGAGGMGEVYRARDTRLDRHVAIKALPPAFAQSAERLARFEREAKLLASLSHAHIAAIYGLEEVDGAPHLVLEFVEGETLVQRLARGPLSLKQTLVAGQEIASAIEAAHERGIIHRDLKPGNVMLTNSGAVKVLDFGLAKAGGADELAGPGLSGSPTRALSATAAGVILGTASYMSPEQARGKQVDRATDVWAIGCLLFECLTGAQTFPGETVSDVIARVLEREPDWNSLPPSTPGRMKDLLRRCLTKDAAARPRDVGDLRRELTAIALDQSSQASLPSTALPSLAVLYFENLADDKESEYFCSGITEDILTDLSKIKGLRVSSRNAVVRYRGQAVDIQKVGAELGVGAVLEGSVRRSGDRVRITAQLINASDGFHLWAERYDRTLQDVFGLQEEIASSIAEALRVALTPSESKNLVQDRPKDARAYDLYLKGRERYGQYSKESLLEALGLFRQATEIDPQYALAWAGMADCHGQFLQYQFTENAEETARLGKEAAERAIAINPGLAEGHKALALVRMQTRDFKGGRESLVKAIEVNPRFTPALINLAVVEYAACNVAGAERFARRALEVDPQEAFAMAWLSFAAMATRREEEAAALVRRIPQVADTPFYRSVSLLTLARLAMRGGHLEEAEAALREGRERGLSSENFDCLEALIAATRGHSERAGALVRRIVSGPGLATMPLVMAATAAIRIGDPDSAMTLLTREIVQEFNQMTVRIEPDLHPLLGRAPFTPRVLATTLVWPLEAPMIDAARFHLFREVKIESGLPGSPGH